MKILVLVHVQTYYGGYENVFEFCKALVEHGHSVTYVSTSNKNRFMFNSFNREEVQIVESPDWLWGNLRNGADPYNALRRLFYFRRKKFDFIYAFDSRPTVIIPALFLKKLKKIPLAQEWHDSYGRGGTINERSSKLYRYTLGYVETFFEEFFRKYADFGVVATSFIKNRLLELGYPPSKILLQRIGSIKKDVKIVSKKNARANLSLEQDFLHFGYLGGLYKNDAQFLFETIESLLLKGHSIRLHLIGRNRLFTHDIDDKKYLKVTGELPEKAVLEYLQACDGLLIPLKASHANLARWPSKVNHYMLAGRPIVSTPVSDFKEIFTENDLGLVSEDDSVEAYSRTIEQFIENSEKWEEYGNNSRKYFDENLDYRMITKRLLNFVNQNGLKEPA